MCRLLFLQFLTWMEGLAKFQASRKAYRSHLTRIYHKIQELDLTQPATEAIASQVSSYLDQLQRKAECIRQLDTKIASEISDPADLEQDVFKAEGIQDSIIEKSTPLRRYLEVNSTRNTEHTTTSTPDSTAPRAESAIGHSSSRLPKLSLPTFSGNPLNWQTFWDSFEAAVLNNRHLTGVEKFNYLRAQLDGDAAKTVSGFPLTNANYDQSIAVLKARFGKQQCIINAHMQALLDLQTPTNTATSLQQLLDSIERGLESLGKRKDSFGDFLIPIVFSKLPSIIRRNLTRDHASEQWTIDELRNAIEKEVRFLESGFDRHSDLNRSTITGSFHAGVEKKQIDVQPRERGVSAKPVCVYCKGSHVSIHCNVITEASARADIVKKERLCFNCLGHHKVTNCNSKNRCKKCHRKHHTRLCTVVASNSSSQNSSPSQTTTQLTLQSTLCPTLQPFTPTSSATESTTTHTLLSNNIHGSICLLKTAVATVKFKDNRVLANILFDEGAQRSLLTQSLADQLKSTSCRTESVCISSFGGESTPKHPVDVITVALETDLGDINISALVVPTIAAPLNNFVTSDVRELPHLQGLKLAHPVTSSQKFDISLLLGADHYWEIVGNHIVRGEGPTAMQSKLGYLLSGPLQRQTQSSNTSVLHACPTQILDASSIANLPELCIDNQSSDNVTSQQLPVPLSDSFIDTFQRHCISRDRDGSYVVRFPWKSNHPILSPNLVICERQTRALARKLGRQPNLLQLYGNIINEQEQCNFIERVSSTDLPNSKGIHYIPHHPVKKNPLTTPVRIVYNCSCRQSRKHASLNDCLMVGSPPLIDTANILLRFRLHNYALSTDIEKAFLHVKLAECDRDFTRFFWLSKQNDPESEFVTYRFKVVLFGSTSSPFMLHATLDYHLNSYHSAVSRDMRNNLYVDNIISGCQSEEDVILYYKDAKHIMSEANFNLRSWASNSQKLQALAKTDGILDSNTSVNLLGLK